MSILDILFPKHCFVCKRLGKYICDICKDKLYVAKYDICIYCGKSSYLGLTHNGCIRKNGIDGFIFLYKYNNYLKRIIKTLKYRLVKDGFGEMMDLSRNPLSTKLGLLLATLNISPILSPIPLNKSKQNRRGFNQSVIISDYLSGHLRLNSKEYLVRSKNTKSQAQLGSRALRYKNIRGAFELKRGVLVKGECILLVDDVVTSCSTVKEACRILKRNGALKIFVFALAKG